MITLGLAVGFVTYIALWLAGAGWYGIANSRWASALSDTGIMPEIHPRALSRQVEEDPVGFFTSIPRITLRGVGLLFHRSDNAAVEVWRLQTERRFFLVGQIVAGRTDIADVISVQIGIDLWERHGLNLQPMHIHQGILDAFAAFETWGADGALVRRGAGNWR